MPKYPSAKNLGTVVRGVQKKSGKYDVVEVDTASDGVVQDLLILGIAMGVSRMIQTPFSHSRVMRHVPVECTLNARLVPLRPRVVVQVIAKKGFKKSTRAREDNFTFKLFYVCSSADRSTLTWFQERAEIDIGLRRSFEGVNKSDWPEGHLYDVASLKEHFVSMYNAGNVPGEHIGAHGVPGMAYPPLDEYDSTHRYVMGAP